MKNARRMSWFERVRKNHGLEHATINVLEKRQPGLRLAGFSTPFGFTIFGPVTLETLAAGIQEAQSRVMEGNRSLVIHERCGTNLATGGIMTALAAWISMLGVKKGMRAQLERIPLAIILTTLALYFSPYVGVKIQQKVTTTSTLRGLEVKSITKRSWVGQIHFWVKTGNILVDG